MLCLAAVPCRQSRAGADRPSEADGIEWGVFVVGGHAAVPTPRVHRLTILSLRPGGEGVERRAETRRKPREARLMYSICMSRMHDLSRDPQRSRVKAARFFEENGCRRRDRC